MRRRLMRSKIHRATITSAALDYEGSLTLDRELMAAADLADHEAIDVVNINNGARFSTYVIPGEPGSGVLQLNGAAARLGMPGDLVIVMAWADLKSDEIAGHRPIVVHVDAQNHQVKPPLRMET